MSGVHGVHGVHGMSDVRGAYDRRVRTRTAEATDAGATGTNGVATKPRVTRGADGEGAEVSGDGEAAELFETFYPRLAGWCRGLVDSDALAEEMAAEAFTRLWSRWRTVDDPRAYLFTVAANLVKDHWRKQETERRAVRLLRAGRQPEHTAPADQGTDLRSLVQKLPERLRMPVLLHYYADLPVDQVAAALRRRPGTVKSDLHKARQLLRAELRGLYEVNA